MNQINLLQEPARPMAPAASCSPDLAELQGKLLDVMTITEWPAWMESDEHDAPPAEGFGIGQLNSLITVPMDAGPHVWLTAPAWDYRVTDVRDALAQLGRDGLVEIHLRYFGDESPASANYRGFEFRYRIKEKSHAKHS